MGVCVYCGKSAGWFCDRHDACFQAAEKPYVDLKNAVFQWTYGAYTYDKFSQDFVVVMKTPGLDKSRGREVVVKGFVEGLSRFLEDKYIGTQTIERVANVMKSFNITWDEVDKAAASAWRKQKTIYYVKRKEYDKTGKTKDGLSVRFLKGEKLLWGFHGVDLREEEVKRRRVGKSAGVRVKLGKRTTVNLGRSEGHWEETIVHPVVDTGVLCVTPGRVYFAGGTNSFHIDIEDIESLSYGSRSITIQRDTDEWDPVMLSDLDGEFAHELLSKLMTEGD